MRCVEQSLKRTKIKKTFFRNGFYRDRVWTYPGLVMCSNTLRAEVVICVYGFTDSPNQCQTRLEYYYFFNITTFDNITTFGFFWLSGCALNQCFPIFVWLQTVFCKPLWVIIIIIYIFFSKNKWALSGDSPTGSPARNTKALQHNILLIDTDWPSDSPILSEKEWEFASRNVIQWHCVMFHGW